MSAPPRLTATKPWKIVAFMNGIEATKPMTRAIKAFRPLGSRLKSETWSAPAAECLRSCQSTRTIADHGPIQ